MTLKHLLVATAVGAGLLTFGTVISEPGVSPGTPAVATSAVSMDKDGLDKNGIAVAAPNPQGAAPRELLAQSSVRRWVFPHGPKY
ncbi:MAG: hypothetical protein U1A78_21475 [Polyangia bacterium]